ncbi:MAG: FMN-binding protein [Candidatus Saccharibacteria bacterium]
MKKFLLTVSMTGIFILYMAFQRANVNSIGVRNPSPAVIGTPLSDQPPAAAGSAQTSPASATGSAGASKPQAASGGSAQPSQTGKYKDGQYVGSSVDAYYGNVQVRVTVQNGKIADVQFLDYPQDRRTSQMINSQAMPYLKEEAIQAQSANVDIVSGATDTSEAFQQSLSSALSQAT